MRLQTPSDNMFCQEDIQIGHAPNKDEDDSSLHS